MLQNIKSKFILRIIFSKMRKRIQLKIVKHNKNLMNSLNIKTKDFKDFQKLKEISQKLNTTIKDIEITDLDLHDKNFGNPKLFYISTFEFKYLKTLNLEYNEISDLYGLEKVNLEQLQVLNLSRNKISDIKVLEKINFKELKELNLRENKITDISVLERER